MDGFLAADIGGTHIRVAAYPTDAIKPILHKRIATRGENTPTERLIDLLVEVSGSLDHVLGIGADVPGYIDPRIGLIYTAPNIPGWRNLPLQAILHERFRVPVALGNDANMAAYGEWEFGAGRGHQDIIYMTISTGIGGGVISDNKLVLGHHGLATEMGHVTVWPEGPMCSCGHRGHLEALASGTAIARWVSEQLALNSPSILSSSPKPTARDISQAAEKGDALAQEALGRAGKFIGQALANYLHIFNSSIIILGGGVSHSGPYLMDPLRSALERNVISPAYLDGLQIKIAELGDDAGLLGSLALIRSQST
jgi:glucokinase